MRESGKLSPGILVLEGADASGKTTLAKWLVRHRAARYLHLGPYRDVWKWHLGAYVHTQKLAAAGNLVVVDRHWPSECIYGEVYRGGSAYPVSARVFDRLWLRSAAIYVWCVPSDVRRQVREHYARDFEKKGNAYSRDRKRAVRDAISHYANPAARSCNDYLSRCSNWRYRPDVIRYDRFTQGHRLAVVADAIIGYLADHRQAQHRLGLDPSHPNFAGHANLARYFIVGETISPRSFRPDVAFPFADRCSNVTAATWLNHALHQLRVPESNLLWCNAVGPELALLAHDLRVFNLPAIALGRAAERTLKSLGWRDVRPVPHPQWARRFEHSLDYTRYLKAVFT